MHINTKIYSFIYLSKKKKKNLPRTGYTHKVNLQLFVIAKRIHQMNEDEKTITSFTFQLEWFADTPSWLLCAIDKKIMSFQNYSDWCKEIVN